MTQKKHSVDMTMGGIYNKIILFALPLMLAGILQSLYNAADMIVVGKFAGKNSLAAVGSTSSAIHLLINIFIGVSSAACVVVARKFGAGNKSGVSKTVHTAIAISIFGGIISTVIGIVLARTIMLLMGSPDDVIELAVLYMRIYFIGIPVVLLYNFGSAILRAIGDTKRPMYFLMLSGVLNILLNLVFVILFKMDVAGVALATVISQAVSAALVIRCLVKTDECYKLYWRKVRIYAKELGEMLYLGIPAGIQSSVFSISNIIIQSSVNSVGSIAMAGSAASSSIEGISYIAMNSFYHATITFIGQNFGARKFDRIRKGFVAGMVFAVLTGVLMAIILCTFAEFFVGIYSDIPEVIACGSIRLRYVCSLYCLCGVMEVGIAGLRGLGTSILPMLISIFGICGIRIVMIILCGPYKTIEDLNILYISYWVSWTVTSVLHCTAFIVLKKKCMQEAVAS